MTYPVPRDDDTEHGDLGEASGMSAPAPAPEELTVLNQQILHALAALRAARMAYARSGTATNVDLRERAQAHLDALLDFYSATRRRHPPRPPSATAGVAVRT